MRRSHFAMVIAVLLIGAIAAAAFADGYGSAPEYMRARYGPHYLWSRACESCNVPNYRACGTVQGYQTRPFFIAGPPDSSLGCATCNVCVAPPTCTACGTYVAPPACTSCVAVPGSYPPYLGGDAVGGRPAPMALAPAG